MYSFILTYYNYYMIKILSQLLDLIYKKRCYFCGCSKENTKMCSKCFQKIKILPSKIIKNIDKIPVYSATVYEKEVQKLIRGIKYHRQKELAFFQAKIMYDFWKKLSISENKYTIVPVPLFVEREKKRKYNQMVLVAQEFSNLTGYDVNTKLIKRVKNTKPQYKLSKNEREKNLKDAFLCNLENYNNEKILIIDDILTTGSTAKEIIKTLKTADLKDITVFVTSCTEYNLNF